METISYVSGMNGGNGYRVITRTPGNIFVEADFETPGGVKSVTGSGREPVYAFLRAAENLIGMDMYLDGGKTPVEVMEVDGVTVVGVTFGCNGLFYTGTGKSQDGIEAAYVAVSKAVAPIIQNHLEI